MIFPTLLWPLRALRMSSRGVALAIIGWLPACTGAGPPQQVAPITVGEIEETPSGEDMTAARAEMVRKQLAARDVTDPRVLTAMGSVPRHRFMPPHTWRSAYGDHPVPIGHDQTISQPYIVAWMTQTLGVEPGQRVLEIGTGSGYQAAVLSELGAAVWSIEIVAPLARQADIQLRSAGYPVVRFDDRVDEPSDPTSDPASAGAPGARGPLHLRTGDGYQGWPEAAPFDRIILTAAPEQIPQPLLDQLAMGGRLIAPVGDDWSQDLVVVERTAEGLTRRAVMAVRFVPMTGEARGE